MPGYVELADKFAAKGVDVVCMYVSTWVLARRMCAFALTVPACPCGAGPSTIRS